MRIHNKSECEMRCVKICSVCAIAPAEIAQLGERQTEDRKVPGSIPGLGKDSLEGFQRLQRSL